MAFEAHSNEREPVVLCIDDDAAVLAALRRTLRSEAYEVITAPSAAEAIDSLKSRPVEVVISDEQMPETSGCEFLAEVRRRWPWVRRVILTGSPGYSVMIRGLEAGVDFIFHKPWDDRALKKVVHGLIYGARDLYF